MFDPYKIYSSRKRPSYKGQVLQKKPIALRGSVSADDYGLIRDYADALGYQLVPKSLPIYEPVDVLYSNSKFLTVNPPNTALNPFTLQDLANNINQMPVFQVVESDKLKIESFGIVVNVCSISFTAPSSPIVRIQTFHLDSGQMTLNGPVVLYGSDNQYSYYLASGSFQGFQWNPNNLPPFYGPVDCYTEEVTGPQAVIEYQNYQLADASLAGTTVAHVSSTSSQTNRSYRIDVHVFLRCKYYPAVQ